MFLSTTVPSHVLDSQRGTNPTIIPFDFARSRQYVLDISPCMTVSRDRNPLTASDAWADTRPDASGGLLTPNQFNVNIPQGQPVLTMNVPINIVQRLIAGTTTGYGWLRSVLTCQVTFDTINNVIIITPVSRTGNFPNETRPVAVNIMCRAINPNFQ